MSAVIGEGSGVGVNTICESVVWRGPTVLRLDAHIYYIIDEIRRFRSFVEPLGVLVGGGKGTGGGEGTGEEGRGEEGRGGEGEGEGC